MVGGDDSRVDHGRGAKGLRPRLVLYAAAVVRPISVRKTQVEDLVLRLSVQRLPHATSDKLIVVLVERLAVGKLVVVDADVPREASVCHAAAHLDPVRQDRNEGVVCSGALVGPAGIAIHDLVHREAFLGAPDEYVAAPFRHVYDESRLAPEPGAVVRVVHVANGVVKPW